MRNSFCREPLSRCHASLVRVAQGLEPADVVIRHASLVSVTTHEVLPDADIAISHGRIAYVGVDGHDATHCVGEGTQVIDATGLYAAPGLMDSHVHVESSMVGVAEYARAVVPHGTTAILSDPHECANVRGLDGVREMYADADRVPLKAMVTTPSCVPAVRDVEDTGASIGPAQVEESMGWPNVVGLGEMMNFPGVLACDDVPMGEIAATLGADGCVTGHYTVPDTDCGLNAYVASGVMADHECSTLDDVVARLRLGMYVQLRQGSAWHSLPGYLPGLLGSGVDLRLCTLCSDDNHPQTLVDDGHMDRILRLAVELGCDPVTAIQMCTINCAECFGLARDLGSLTPGKCADVVLLEDLESFVAKVVLIDGEVVARDGEALFDAPSREWPDWMTHTMDLGRVPDEGTFRFEVDRPDGTARVRAMGVAPGDTLTRDVVVEVPVRDGQLCADPDHDVLKVCVFDRHHGEAGTHSQGFVTGFGIHGALAQTVSHDAHNLLVMGDNERDMALAARTLSECGGGEVAVADGEVLALVELPVCGLMSTEPVEDVARKVRGAEAAWQRMGCTMPSPFMTMGVMSLACIPELRLTNRGYVNCLTFQMEDLLVD